MKKILTVSLFAVMAVSAAHADIASTNYVGTQLSTFKTANIDPINTTIGTWGADQQAIGASVAAAVVNLSGDIAAMTGSGEGSVSQLISTAKGEAIAAAAQDATTKANDAQAAAEATAAADATAKANAAQAAAVAAAATDATNKANTAEENAKKYADDALLLKEDVANKVASDTAYGQLSPAEQAKAYPTYGAMVTYVGNVQNNLNTDVAANANAIEILNGDGEGSVAAAVKAEEDRAKLAEQANANAIAAINNAETGALAQANDYTDQKVEALDATVAVEANSNKFVTGVVEENGVLTGVQSSTINDAVVALGEVPTECGANGTNKCALSVQGGTFYWEIIEN